MHQSSIAFEDLVTVPSDVFELPRFLAWTHSETFPETGRISLIGGNIEVDMSPEELESHTKLKGDVHTDLNVFVRARSLGDVLIDGALYVSRDAGLVTEPDIMYCSWISIRAGRVVYSEASKGSGRLMEVRGSPDLAVEIVSQTSVRKVTVRLKEAYFVAGIREYWIVDARGKTVEFRIFERGAKGFVDSKKDGRGFRWSPVFDCWFKIERRANPVGGGTYRLLAREPK